MKTSTNIIGFVTVSLIGVLVGLWGIGVINESRFEKAYVKDIIDISAPTSFMRVTPTDNLETDLQSYQKALQGMKMPPGRVVEKIGINNNADHIYIIKYWMGDKNRGDNQEYSGIFLSKDSLVPGNEMHFIVAETILLSKTTPYRFCLEKHMKGRNISKDWSSIPLCIDANKNAIVDHISTLRQKRQDEIRFAANLEAQKQAYIIAAQQKAQSDAETQREQNRLAAIEKEHKLKMEREELAIKQKEIALAQKQDARIESAIESEQRLKDIAIDTKALIVTTLAEINLSLEGIDEMNVSKDFTDNNTTTAFLISQINNNITVLTEPLLKDVYALAEYAEFVEKAKNFTKFNAISAKKKENWAVYVARINDPKKKQEQEELLAQNRRIATYKKRQAEERATQRRLDYYRSTNMQPRQTFTLGFMRGEIRN